MDRTRIALAVAPVALALCLAAPARAQEPEPESEKNADAPADAADAPAEAADAPAEAADAPAEAADAPADATGEKWGGKKRDHRHQGFVSVLAGTGWYLVAPYDKNDPDKACDWKESNNSNTTEGEGEPICSGRSPFHLDFQAGFGVLDGFEVFAMFRLGVEPSGRYQPDARLIGAGIKVYSPSDGLFKIGFGVAPLFDFSERRVNDAYDFLIHVPIAAHFDFVPWFGAYLQVAPNISFITEFKLDITGGLGLQGRFP